MLFWIIAAFLSFAAAMSVVVPLARRRGGIVSAQDLDKAIYHSRIEEIERDRVLGRISDEEARAAVAEEGRRLIANARPLPENAGPESTGAASPPRSTAAVKFAVLASLIAIPGIALPLYLYLGSPGKPDQTLASRMSADPASQPIGDLLGRAEAHLARNPDDVQGWMVVAPVYTRLERYQDAARAWANVLRLNPETPEIRSLLAEMLVASADGMVTADARQLFEDELVLDPSSARSRFYLAMGLSQEGKSAEALAAWDTLIAGANPEAPWLPAARDMRNQMAALAGEAITAPGPTREQVEAAQEMPEADRAQMIEQMVAGLAERLASDPSDKASWQRLVRSYIVLGKTDEAQKAIDAALLHHGGDAGFAEEMNKAREQLQN